MTQLEHELERCDGPLYFLVSVTNTRAIRLYERFGFRHVAELPFVTSKGEVGRWIMLREL